MTNSERLSRRAFVGRTAAIGLVGLTASLPAAVRGQASAPQGGAWQIGCYTRPWAKYDYRTAMDAIAAAGFKYLGLMTTNTKSHLILSVASALDEAARVGDEAKRRGLGIVSLYGGDFSVASRQAAVADLRHLVDLCAAAEAKSLLLAGIANPQQFDLYFGAIADGCDYAAEKKIGLTMKPHGGLNPSGPLLRKAAEKVGRGNFSIWYDAGNILFYSDGKIIPVEDCAAVDGMVTGWCIKDYRHPKRVDVNPGEGQVDFQAVFARLKKGGFQRGPLVVETLTPGEPKQLLEEAKKARQFVERMTA